MKFGYVENPDSVDFTLPEDHELTNNFLKQNKERQENPKIYIGCPVWSEKSYVGKIYPPGTRANRYLESYSKQFNSIELNATRYGKPKASTIEQWKSAVTPDFKFSPKIPQYISHRRNLADDVVLQDTMEFIDSISGLEENLGRSFIQLPPHFGPNRLNELAHFLVHLPRDFQLSVEVRHPDFFSDPRAFQGFYSMLQELNINWVITDVSGRRDVLHQALTTNEVIVRFAGNKLHPSDFTRVDAWVDRLVSWVNGGVTSIYFFPHQPAPVKFYTADIAARMIAQLNERLNLKLKIPVSYQKNAVESIF